MFLLILLTQSNLTFHPSELLSLLFSFDDKIGHVSFNGIIQAKDLHWLAFLLLLKALEHKVHSSDNSVLISTGIVQFVNELKLFVSG